MPFLHLFADGVKSEGLTPPQPVQLEALGTAYGVVLWKYDAMVGPELAAIGLTVAVVLPVVLEYHHKKRAEEAKDAAPPSESVQRAA